MSAEVRREEMPTGGVREQYPSGLVQELYDPPRADGVIRVITLTNGSQTIVYSDGRVDLITNHETRSKQ